MNPLIRSQFVSMVVCVILGLSASRAEAQWITLRTQDVPRSADGKPDLTAPAPQQGQNPDLGGCGGCTPLVTATMSRLISGQTHAFGASDTVKSSHHT